MVELIFINQDTGRMEDYREALTSFSFVGFYVAHPTFFLNQISLIMAQTKSLVFSKKAVTALANHFLHVMESDGGISRLRSGMVYGLSHLLASQDKHPVDEALKIANSYKDHNEIYDIIEDMIDFGELKITNQDPE